MTEVPLFSRDAFAVRCVGSPGMRNEHAEVTSPSSERDTAGYEPFERARERER